MMGSENKSVSPSLALGFLSALVGIRIVDLVRYSWWPVEDVASECNISDEQAFALTAGPLGIVFENGEILGLASDPSMNSVMVWNEGGRYISSPGATLEQDGELFPISAQDQEYAAPFWKKVIGATVVQLEVLKPKVMSIKKRELPSEVGLRFQLQNGLSFVASHGLHDGSDDFSVLEESQIVPMEFEELVMNLK